MNLCPGCFEFVCECEKRARFIAEHTLTFTLHVNHTSPPTRARAVAHHKIAMIKALRLTAMEIGELTTFGLKEAKDLVDRPMFDVPWLLTRKQALQLGESLKAAGATVTLIGPDGKRASI